MIIHVQEIIYRRTDGEPKTIVRNLIKYFNTFFKKDQNFFLSLK